VRRRFPGLRKLILFAGDLAIVAASSYAAMFLVVAYSGVNLDRELYQRMLPVMLSVVGVLLILDGLLSLTRKKYSEVFIDIAIVMLKMFVIMMAISFFLRDFAYSRSILIVATTIQFVGLALWNKLCWQIEHDDMIPRRVLVMGNDNETHILISRLRNHSYLKDHVQYVCQDFESGQWKAYMNDVDLVILCSDIKLGHKAAMLHYCQMNEKQVFIIPDFYEMYCSNVDLDKIDDIPVFRPRYLKPTTEQKIMKRCLDFAVALIATVGLIPVFILVAIAIKADSPGPVFFRQRRVGEKEKEFTIYKFRTMCVDAEKQTGPVLASVNDPRITRVGRFIRATRIDELPQLANVLIGNMSIVGPRPERLFFVEMLKKELPEYIHRSNVKPGITGMAQVYGKYNTSPYSKLVYDLIYIQNFSIIFDIALMLKTVRVLLSKSQTEGVGKEKLDEPAGYAATAKHSGYKQ
jgi:exopolysaccharide biosynthesis polyprenyl glycosylphosphotransferase